MAKPNTQAQVIADETAQAQRRMRGFEDEDVSALMQSYLDAQTEIQRLLYNTYGSDDWSLSGMTISGRGQKLLAEIQQILTRLQSTSTSQIEDATASQYVESTASTAYMLDQATPDNIDVVLPSIPDDAVRALVNQEFEGARFSDRIGIITDAAGSDIRDQLLQSMIQGESMDDAGARVAKVLGATYPDDPTGLAYRADTIARTEIMRAQNTGRDQTYDSNKDIMEDDPEWIATEDDRLCQWCMRRDGLSLAEVRNLPEGDDPFGNDDTIPLHPNCRCTTAPRLKSWKSLGIDIPDEADDDARSQRGEDGQWTDVSLQTYDDWKEERGLTQLRTEGRTS